jgi:hypothetical protein
MLVLPEFIKLFLSDDTTFLKYATGVQLIFAHTTHGKYKSLHLIPLESLLYFLKEGSRVLFSYKAFNCRYY